MTSIGKVAVSITTISALGGAGAYAGGLFDRPKPKETITKISISKQLEIDGFNVLDTERTSQDWTDVLSAYNQSNTKTFLDEAKKEEADLRNKCRDVLKLFSDNSSYSSAKRWCVKKEKMETVLKKGGYKKLKSDGNIQSEEQIAWNAKIKELKNTSPNPFPSLAGKIKDEANEIANSVKALREECEKIKIGEIHTTDEKFESNFDLVKKWCSIKETTLKSD